jgi:hypothetical protein
VTLMSEQPVNDTANDWVRRPGMGFVWWCVPLGVGLTANYFAPSPRAIALALLAGGIALLGSHSLNNIVGITLTVALLSFVPEMIWRKYL